MRLESLLSTATQERGMDELHPSHVTRISMDASSYDEICINCGATDHPTGGLGRLALPCPKPVGKGGLTIEEYHKKEVERVKKLEAKIA